MCGSDDPLPYHHIVQTITESVGNVSLFSHSVNFVPKHEAPIEPHTIQD